LASRKKKGVQRSQKKGMGRASAERWWVRKEKVIGREKRECGANGGRKAEGNCETAIYEGRG